MNFKDLNNLFKQHNQKPADFIRWANSLGYKVDPATVSRHRSGAQGITVPWAIAYTVFFELNKKDRAKAPSPSI